MQKYALWLKVGAILFGVHGVLIKSFVSEQEPMQEKSIVVVIASYNNSAWCDWNLSTVFAQHYANYRIMYIDDCSTDNTYDLVLQKMHQEGMSPRMQLIRSHKNQGPLANIYMAVHACADEEIIVILDGDDAFAHAHVLARINRAYHNENVWMTYGQYIESITCDIGRCAAIPRNIIQNNAYRKYRWVSSHVRTFYAWLFKRINKESLMCDGEFFSAATDLAVMFPLLELAGGRFEFIDEVLYVYNTTNRPDNFKTKRRRQQIQSERVIRDLPRYMSLLPILNC